MTAQNFITLNSPLVKIPDDAEYNYFRPFSIGKNLSTEVQGLATHLPALHSCDRQPLFILKPKWEIEKKTNNTFVCSPSKSRSVGTGSSQTGFNLYGIKNLLQFAKGVFI